MVNLPSELAWSIVKKQNAGMRFGNRRNGPRLAAEAGNVMNIPSRTYSGFANAKVVGVENDGTKSVLMIKTSKAGSNPNRMFEKVQLRSHGRGTKRCISTIKKRTSERYYRGDLTRLAAAKLCRYAKAERRAAAGVEYKAKTRSNKK